MRNLAAAVIALLFAVTAAAAADDVSSLLTPIREKHKIPGIAVMLMEDGRITAQGVSGVRKDGDATPMTLDDKFHLGSCTKSMTATLIAGLVEEKKLSWTTTLGEVFPEMKGKMDPAWEPVTLELLLTHRAGVPSNLNKDGLWGRLWQRKGTPTQQRLELLEGVTKNPPVHKPGTDYEYANAGFAIAGAMAERVTGKAWEDLIQERVFRPLGITTAGFGAPGTPEIVDQPWGHHTDGKPESPGVMADNPAAIGPGGTVHMTMEDWGKYLAAHVEGARHEHAEALSTPLHLQPETWLKLHAPFQGPAPEYAMGWSVSARPWAKGKTPGDTGRVLTHNGSNTMWFCVAWLAPEQNCVIYAACNKGGDEAAKACDEAVWAVIQKHVAGK